MFIKSVLVLAVAGLLTACASYQKKPRNPLAGAECTSVPQWHTTNVNGKAVGIYVCFSGQDNHLLYKPLVLPDQPQPQPDPTTKEKRQQTRKQVQTGTPSLK